jgi:ketosteroid isomerase-like protein
MLNTNGDMATVCNVEKGKNKDNKGEMREISIRATNTFRKEGGKWKMVGHHVDLLSNFKD